MPWWSCHQNRFFFHFIKGGSCTSSYEGLRAPCLIFGTYPPMPVFRGKQAACRAGVSHTCVRSYVRVLYAVNTCKKVYERQLRRCTRVVHKRVWLCTYIMLDNFLFIFIFRILCCDFQNITCYSEYKKKILY